MLLLATSFIAGILTVLAPCTIALLPVIVGGTLAGARSMRRVLTVTVSLGISVLAFTFLLKVSTAFVAVPQLFWEILSGAIIALIGLAFFFPTLWDRVTFFAKLNRDSNKVLAQGYLKQSLWGDVIVGASLGPVFSSCSPTYFLIIATILPKSIFAGFFDLLAYVIGLSGMLLVVGLAGQNLLEHFNIAADPKSWLRRGIGALFIVVGLSIAFGLEQRLELAFANSSILNLPGIEQWLLGARNGAPAVGTGAPEITNPSGFINTGGQPITIGQFKGKDVLLIDFWDYSCINCEREIPYVEAWYEKYKDAGLVVIGVHTPEFSFEKLESNVGSAVRSFGITYPVVLDNDYATWDAFNNQYWPQIYLINIDGQIVYSHSGEGDYPQTEEAIQGALARRDEELNAATSIPTGIVSPNAVEVNGDKLASPETYFGSDRNEYLANGAQGAPGLQTLTLPTALVENKLYLGGSWTFSPQYAEAGAGATVEYQFDAKNMYLVATGNPSAVIEVLLDDKPVGTDAGADVSTNGMLMVNADKLYHLISLPDYGVHTLELKVVSGSLDAYTFTFG